MMEDQKKLLSEMGLTNESLSKVESLLELRKNPPAMLIAEALVDFQYSINNGAPQLFKKGSGKIMSPGLFMMLENSSRDKISKLRPSRTKFKDIYRPYMGQNLSGKKLLVWRTGGFGDFLFIQPSMRYIKKMWPDSEIYFSCAPTFQAILKNWTCFDRLIEFPVPDTYLHLCDYHATFEGVIERTREATYTNSYKLFSTWLGLDIPNSDLVPILKTEHTSDRIVEEYLKKNGIDEYDYITCQLRASSPIRTPNSTCWKNIFLNILETGKKIIITDSPMMTDRIDAFIKHFIPDEFKKSIFNFSSKSSDIFVSVSLINKAAMCLAPDSSFIHISQAVGCPVLGLYGPFSGDIRMSTYSNADWCEPMESDICSFRGRRCYKHGQYCEFFTKGQTSPCLNYYDYNEILKKVKKLYDARKNGYTRREGRNK